MQVADINREKLLAMKQEIQQAYEDLKAQNLSLDLTRGKPSAQQLDFSNELLDLPGDSNAPESYTTADGTDTRNYGGLIGIKELRDLWADLLGINAANLIAADSSSLNIVFDLISFAMQFGTPDSATPWNQDDSRTWICPVPGYDRHHSITELFGFRMVTVPLLDDGPDMEQVKELVKDPSVKGMWTVPIFSNPTGTTYSREVIEELAAMNTAAPDFRIVWDNAYAVHTLTEEFPTVHNVIDIAADKGNPNRFWFMSSTSKITFAGAGVAFFASSEQNLDWYKKFANIRGIGPNKVNQLAHARYFHDAEGVRVLMRKHAGSLAPKFQAVTRILEQRLDGLGVAEWTDPSGGYFISVNVVEGTAARVVELAGEAGVKLTAAGSTYPKLQDPQNRNLRLAPSMPTLDQLEVAMDGFATCVLLAALEVLEA